MEPKARGVLTESKVLSRLLEEGADVSQPFGDNCRYDYIVDIDSELIRVQVKTAREATDTNGAIIFNTESVKSNINQNRREDYNGDIDAFIAYYPENNTCYWIDIKEASTGSMYIRIAPPENPNPNINWAEDYELTERFK